jgi:hypothetical protein
MRLAAVATLLLSAALPAAVQAQDCSYGSGCTSRSQTWPSPPTSHAPRLGEDFMKTGRHPNRALDNFPAQHPENSTTRQMAPLYAPAPRPRARRYGED